MRKHDADPFAGRTRSSGRRGAEQEVRTACRPCGRAAQGGREGFTGRQRGWSRGGERRGRNVEATGVSSRRKRRTQGEFSGTWTKGRFTGSRLAVVSKSQNMRQRRMCVTSQPFTRAFSYPPLPPPKKRIPFIATHDSFRGIWDLEESLEIIWLSHFLEISFTTLTTDGRLEQCCFCYDLFSLIIRFYGALLS